MKLLLLSLISLASVLVFAQDQVESIAGPPQLPPQVIYIQANGSAFGQCDGINSSFCVSNIQRQAVNNGGMQTQQQCSMQGGQLMATPTCSSYCFPNYISPGAPMQMVNCHSTCSAPCQIGM